MKTKSNTKMTTNQWVLKNKETGKVYSNWTYPSRKAARKASKGRRFKGMYTPVRSGDGGIDPKKLKKGKPAPNPKSSYEFTEANLEQMLEFLLSIADVSEDALETVEIELNDGVALNSIAHPNTTKESINTMTVRKPVNTKPRLRSRSSAPGAKFHRHGTFGVK